MPTTTKQPWVDQWARQSEADEWRKTPVEPGPSPALLYALFDAAHERINQARLASGRPDLIHRQSCEGERWYSEPGYRGALRTLTLFPRLSLAEAPGFDGVYVAHCGAGTPISLVPVRESDPAHWCVQETGLPFTAREANDLFLAIFEADIAAARRLAGLYGIASPSHPEARG